MTAYEFYVQDKTKGKRLIGILPERRTDQRRVSNDSVMNWAILVFGHIFKVEDISFTRVTLAKHGFGNYSSIDH